MELPFFYACVESCIWFFYHVPIKIECMLHEILRWRGKSCLNSSICKEERKRSGNFAFDFFYLCVHEQYYTAHVQLYNTVQ